MTKRMLSRVADSIYWMSRYIERADNVARFIGVNMHLMLDSEVNKDQQWLPLIDTSGDSEAFRDRYPVSNQNNVIRFLVFDTTNPNSVLSCLKSARENARTVREMITASMWHQLNEFYLLVSETSEKMPSYEALNRFLVQIHRETAAFMGLKDSSMTRGEPWHFSNLGQMLERADKTSRLLDVKYFILLKSADQVGAPIDEIQWSAVLRSVSGFEMYRKKIGRIAPFKVVDYLLFDPLFPRSVRYCLLNAQDSLHAITGTPAYRFSNDAERRLGSLCSELVYARVDHVIQSGLHQYIDDLQLAMNAVGDDLHAAFFAKKQAISPPIHIQKRKEITSVFNASDQLESAQ